jgi:hypothetical protein
VYVPDLAATVRLTCVLVGVSLLLGALEQLAIVREYRRDGLYSWSVFSTHFPEFGLPLARPLFSAVFGYAGVCVLLACTVVAASTLLVPGLDVPVYAIPVAAALLIKCALAYRNFYGSDGSDQMETMVLAGLCAALVLYPALCFRRFEALLAELDVRRGGVQDLQYLYVRERFRRVGIAQVPASGPARMLADGPVGMRLSALPDPAAAVRHHDSRHRLLLSRVQRVRHGIEQVRVGFRVDVSGVVVLQPGDQRLACRDRNIVSAAPAGGRRRHRHARPVLSDHSFCTSAGHVTKLPFA